MRWYLFILLPLLLIGCDVPKAAPEKNPVLVIATDQIIEGDSLLFAEFEAKHHVEIVLKQMSADSLIECFKNSPYSLGIDVVLLHHAYDMRKVRNEKLLEPLSLGTFPKEAFLPQSRLFITCGIDPYVCVAKQNVRVNIYDDLNRHSFFMNLDHKSKTHFFAPYEERLHRAKTFEKLEKLHENALEMNPWMKDSSDAILTTYSDFKSLNPEDSLWNDFTELRFPNSATSGVFYDVLTAGIIQQSSHFSFATEFLEWLTSSQMNQRFTANHNYEPIRSSGKYRRFSTPPHVLMQYHTMIERMFEEID
ncbi:MAG: hypothetical protein NXI10_04710 [bacterium]|nr:hypothetical protein [bacterium]